MQLWTKSGAAPVTLPAEDVDAELRTWLAEARQVGDRRHGGGVAGQDHRLGTLIAEEPGDMAQALANVVGGFFAIGHVTAVGHVQQRLIGQQALDFGEYRQAADPRIHHANRRQPFSHGG